MIEAIRDIVIIAVFIILVCFIFFWWFDGIISKIKKRRIKKAAVKPLPGNSMTWKYFNANPHMRNTGDCVIRGLSILLSEDWDSIYDSLSDIGFEIKEVLSSSGVFRKHLTDLGYKRIMVNNVKFKDIKHNGSMLIEQGEHVVYSDGEFIYDTFNSEDYYATSYWILIED